MIWCEADISTPEKLSLNPDQDLKKGRVRIGIIEQNQYLEKSVRIYAKRYNRQQDRKNNRYPLRKEKD
jgi:hypothetical protein